MSSKKFGSIVDALQPMTDETPSIHRTPEKIIEEHREGEGGAVVRPPQRVGSILPDMSQYLLKLRTDLRDELIKLAANNGKTIRGFIMHALKEQGLEASEADMIDRRKKA